jgi:pimeloyl-ACP methyl ester carboxylesterase
MPHVMVNGLSMYFEEHGHSSGDPLVLLHGFTVTGDYWSRQVPVFGEHYRLIVPDLRGHGRTDNPGGLAAMNHRQFARDIIALCQSLDIGRAIFCGESTGAMLLLTLALEAPEIPRALVLAGGTFVYGDELRAWWRTQTPETIFEDAGQARRRHVAMGPDHWRLCGEAFIALGTHAHADDFPEPEDLAGIAAPTLIVHGDRDPMFPVDVPAGLYRLLPDAELCILPRVAHHPPRERPDWFNQIALDFLSRRAE